MFHSGSELLEEYLGLVACKVKKRVLGYREFHVKKKAIKAWPVP